MKKLLSLLTISTLATSVPAPLLANTVQTRVKRDVGVFNSNNDYLPLKEIDGITDKVNAIVVDSNNTIYFGTEKGAFLLKPNYIKPTKIDLGERFIYIYSLAVDKNNNIYFGTNNGAYKLSAGSTTPTKIDGINGFVDSIFVDNNNNIYFNVSMYGIYVLKPGYIKPFKIDNVGRIIYFVIDKNNNIYFSTENGAYNLVAGSTTPTKIDGISGNITFISVDVNNNIYFSTENGAYKLSAGSTTPTKIDGISDILWPVVDSNNNIYFGTENGAYKLVAGSTTPTKIDGISGFVKTIAVDKNNNIYFGTNNGAYKLSAGSTTPTKIDGINEDVKSITIDSKENIYFGTNNGAFLLQTALSWVKTQSQFTLVDSTKAIIWTRPFSIVVDGELNIDIDNEEIEEVYWDGAKQNMLEHKVNINVKPETSEKNHNLQVIFTFDGKQYTSEIIVSMQAKIEPPTPSVKENLSDVIKFDNNNDLNNIIDNNDDTIKTAITQKNARTVDFSQIEIINKTDTQATLSAIEGSKSYKGAVDVTYNVVPATTVDLKIDLTSSASGVQIDKDYLAQLDKSKMTNKVDTFYYANGKSVVKIKQPSTGNVITGKIYGCDDKWNKTSQSNTIDPVNGLEIDKGHYGSVDGRYLIELQHSTLPTHTKTIYLQISEKQKTEHYWDTPNGKNFEQWAEDNGEKNIRGSSASKLNNLFEVSKTWKQSLKHLNLKLDNFVVAKIKNVTQDEIDTYKTKMLAIVKEQVEQYASNVVENIDYVISVDNLVAGDWTASKDVKVQAIDGSTKLLSLTAKTISVQQKDEPTPNPTPTPDNKKGSDSKLWIIGVVVGVLAGLGIAYLMFKRFVFDKYFLPKIKRRRHLKLVEQVRKEEAEKNVQNNKEGEE